MRSMPALPLESRTCKVFDWQYCLSALLIAAACMGIQLECRGQDRPESSEVAESTPSSDTRIRRPVNITPYDVKSTPLYERIKTSINSVRAIDTHDHLRAFDQIPGRVMTAQGHGMTLHSLWSNSYLVRTTRISPWPADGLFDTWWDVAHDDFNDVRATSFYRYLLPAFRDLYGVDFDTVTPLEARKLNERIHANYKTDEWLRKVIVERANIELMFIDPYWSRLQFAREYPFAVPVLNVTTIMRGSHSERFAAANNSPYAYAQRRGLSTTTFTEFLAVIDELFAEAVASNAVCLKSTQAYQRTLHYEHTSREQASSVYGRSPDEVSEAEQKQFEDFMFWHICELSAKYELPFQVHTGDARIQGSNPMLLVNVIAGNPETKFILFHGGYPWVGETGAIAMKHRNVWIDSCWLPTLSYTMARRAYQEWLDAVPSDRIMWGADTVNAEGIYAATEFTRQCLAEALAEKVGRGELTERDALHIGRQIMRDNALKLFPKLKRLLWRSAPAEQPRP
jgi:predicted TIM-barrel fold metal-dependent hydrolase